jgi:hypothetical protein
MLLQADPTGVVVILKQYLLLAGEGVKPHLSPLALRKALAYAGDSFQACRHRWAVFYHVFTKRKGGCNPILPPSLSARVSPMQALVFRPLDIVGLCFTNWGSIFKGGLESHLAPFPLRQCLAYTGDGFQACRQRASGLPADQLAGLPTQAPAL